MIRKVACEYCDRYVTRNLLTHHLRACPLSRDNLNRILIWIRDYIERSSQYNRVRLYPKAVHYNLFAKRNRILSYNSLRRIFPDSDWKTILEQLVEIGVTNGYVTDDEFPPYLRAMFSSTQFLRQSEYHFKVQTIEDIESSLLGHDWRLR